MTCDMSLTLFWLRSCLKNRCPLELPIFGTKTLDGRDYRCQTTATIIFCLRFFFANSRLRRARLPPSAGTRLPSNPVPLRRCHCLCGMESVPPRRTQSFVHGGIFRSYARVFLSMSCCPRLFSESLFGLPLEVVLLSCPGFFIFFL